MDGHAWRVVYRSAVMMASDTGTLVRLTHEGSPDEQYRDGHQEAWPMALEMLDKALRATT